MIHKLVSKGFLRFHSVVCLELCVFCVSDGFFFFGW